MAFPRVNNKKATETRSIRKVIYPLGALTNSINPVYGGTHLSADA